MKTEPEYICKSELLTKGWTERAIQDILPEPVKKINPRYKKAVRKKLKKSI